MGEQLPRILSTPERPAQAADPPLALSFLSLHTGVFVCPRQVIPPSPFCLCHRLSASGHATCVPVCVSLSRVSKMISFPRSGIRLAHGHSAHVPQH